ncbi:MAG: PD-(D/E)XK nuclease family protein [Muribaculaceae bacterium]|nr:PD-(D/E)XK nuclease family protein [Muribaculaceae bacterium]
MKNLLEQAGLLLRQTELKQEEAKKRGERFNMFGACGVNHYETTHSAIIASLLDPLGSHGQGNLFLKQWLQVMDMSNVVDAETARVQTEFTTDTGRIDILIEDESHRAVIIENKIYAPDQYKQLERYDKYANDAYHGRENYKIVYLTLFGNEASPQSASDVQYVRASYARHIIDWLGVCIDKSATFPLIRETLIQYRNHIKTLTNQDMEINEKQELLKLMVEHAKEVDAIMAIANTDYGKYVFDSKVKPELEKYADSRDLICKCENLYETRGERGIFFYRPEWKGMAIRLWSSYSSERSFFWGISNYTAGCDMSRLRNKYKLKCLNGAPEDAWPYGWEYSDRRYRNWDFASGTISAMCNGEFVQYVTNKVDEILKEIELQKVEMI